MLLLIRCAATEDDNNVVANGGREYDPNNTETMVFKGMLDQAMGVEKPPCVTSSGLRDAQTAAINGMLDQTMGVERRLS